MRVTVYFKRYPYRPTESMAVLLYVTDLQSAEAQKGAPLEDQDLRDLGVLKVVGVVGRPVTVVKVVLDTD